jgi:hypothetical protein
MNTIPAAMAGAVLAERLRQAEQARLATAVRRGRHRRPSRWLPRFIDVRKQWRKVAGSGLRHGATTGPATGRTPITRSYT